MLSVGFACSVYISDPKVISTLGNLPTASSSADCSSCLIMRREKYSDPLVPSLRPMPFPSGPLKSMPADTLTGIEVEEVDDTAFGAIVVLDV